MIICIFYVFAYYIILLLLLVKVDKVKFGGGARVDGEGMGHDPGAHL